jgi:hypothetical protein
MSVHEQPDASSLLTRCVLRVALSAFISVIGDVDFWHANRAGAANWVVAALFIALILGHVSIGRTTVNVTLC